MPGNLVEFRAWEFRDILSRMRLFGMRTVHFVPGILKT